MHNDTQSQEKEVATPRQMLRHAENIEDKKTTFMVATVLQLSHKLKYA